MKLELVVQPAAHEDEEGPGSGRHESQHRAAMRRDDAGSEQAKDQT